MTEGKAVPLNRALLQNLRPPTSPPAELAAVQPPRSWPLCSLPGTSACDALGMYACEIAAYKAAPDTFNSTRLAQLRLLMVTLRLVPEIGQ